MIWVRGEIVPDDALKISVLDRTFEHGLGLFETLRTWNGCPVLLPRHLARMRNSAEELGLPLDPAALPDADAIARLIKVEGIEEDTALRITMSGGLSDEGGAVVWMRTMPLPTTPEGGVARIAPFGWEPDSQDDLTRHKTLNYWSRRNAFALARQFEKDELLSSTHDLLVWEGSRTNLFVVEGNILVTPPAHGPLVPGIMRAFVLETAREMEIRTCETDVTINRLATADEFFLTNAVRGVIPAFSAGRWINAAPGPMTLTIRDEVLRRLHQGNLLP